MTAGLPFVFFLIVLTSLCDTANHLGLKVCADKVGIEVTGFQALLRFSIRILSLPLAWLSIAFSLISLFLWVYVLTKADLSLAFSLDSMHHVFIALAARMFLKESVGWTRFLGTFCIMGGIVLVGFSG